MSELAEAPMSPPVATGPIGFAVFMVGGKQADIRPKHPASLSCTRANDWLGVAKLRRRPISLQWFAMA